jgi:hypothetical protein
LESLFQQLDEEDDLVWHILLVHCDTN